MPLCCSSNSKKDVSSATTNGKFSWNTARIDYFFGCVFWQSNNNNVLDYWGILLNHHHFIQFYSCFPDIFHFAFREKLLTETCLIEKRPFRLSQDLLTIDNDDCVCAPYHTARVNGTFTICTWYIISCPYSVWSWYFLLYVQ